MKLDAAPTFSELAITHVSAARRDSVRFIAASSASPVVSPASGCTPVTPSRNTSADTPAAASAAAAPRGHDRVLEQPAAEQEDLHGGWSTSATAIVGLWVTTVSSRCGSARATASAVVPPSRITVRAGRISSRQARATRSLLSTATAWRVA